MRVRKRMGKEEKGGEGEGVRGRNGAKIMMTMMVITDMDVIDNNKGDGGDGADDKM